MSPDTAHQTSRLYVADRLAEADLRRQRTLARQARREARAEARRAAAIAATPSAPMLARPITAH